MNNTNCQEGYFLCSFGCNLHGDYSSVDFCPKIDYDNHCYDYKTDLSDKCPYIGSSTGILCLMTVEALGTIYTFIPTITNTSYDPIN